MNYERITNESLEASWAEDKKLRGEPEVLTKLFHQAVPVLQYLDWKVIDIERGFTETVLPLNVTSTNQHITHQAAVILIAADYTGGIALSTLFPYVPLVGIHPQKTDYAAYLWGATADIKWIKPSCDNLVCIARIPKERHAVLANRFFKGKRVLETVKIDMYNGDNIVAEANIKYWVQDTYALRKNAFDENRINILYKHRQSTSAKLIAGLRFLEQEKLPNERLFEDKFAELLAENHGRILAQRFCLIAPQLQPMVASRTKNLDDAINDFHKNKPIQIVNIGVGLDTRILRLNLPSDSIVFELDLPVMLRRRNELFEKLQSNSSIKRISIPLDLHEHEPAVLVIQHEEFNKELPTFVIWEGGSMYFNSEDTSRILSSISDLLIHNDSLCWIDYVYQSVIDRTTGITVVDAFMDAMSCLGEPFIQGFSNIEQQLNSCNLTIEKDVASSHYLTDTTDPVFELYRFCLIKRLGEINE